MTEQAIEKDTHEFRNLGWRVTFAGLGINLALGVLYSWSILSSGMDQAGWGWTQSEKSLPYAVACLVFCLVMVPAGRMQDRIGPRTVASIGGVLVGVGMILASLSGNSHWGWIIGFGVLTGAGIGFGYASATPPAVKWFPPQKTGMIAGIVVSGFGLASVYIAPLGSWLISNHGLAATAMAFGIGFLVVVVSLAQFLKPPPRVLQFEEDLGRAGELKSADAQQKLAPQRKRDYAPTEMLKTWQFWLLWFMYACGAGAGLMVISVAKKLGASSGAGVIAVTTLAIGNGAGRIVAGMLSDKLGRKATMCLFFVSQAVMVLLLGKAAGGGALGGAAAMAVIAALVGANYGANLALFPSATKDFYGLKNFGVNYGLVFTAWGIGGYLLAQFAARVYDGKVVESWKGSFDFAFFTSAALLVLAAIATWLLRPPAGAAETEVS